MAYQPLPVLGQAAMAASLPVVIASNQSTVPVSVASLPLPTGAATEATLAAASAKLPASLGQKLMAASLAVVLASDQSSIPVTGAFYQATQPVSVASLPLPTGAATEATLSAASAKLPATLGQKAMAASMAVVLASDQSAIPVSQSGTWNVGTVTTVTTVSTVTNLSQMGGQAIAMGTGVRTAGTQRVTIATDDSVPVTGTFWQATQPVSLASVPLPTGAATEATLSAASAKLPATLGQKAMTASMAVVIASDQSAVSINLSQIGTNTINVGAGAIGTGTQRITVATDCQVDTYTTVVQASGSITALDAVVGAPGGAGALVSGASTAGSLVFVTALGGEDTWEAHIGGGSFTATIYFEGSHNSTTGTDGGWIALKAQRLGMDATTIAFGSSATNCVWRGSMSGFKMVRARMVGAAWVSAPTVILRLSRGGGSVTLNDMLPTGTNVIGALVANQSVNVAQMNGVAVTMGSGVVGTGVQRVVLATDVALPTGDNVIGRTKLTDGTNVCAVKAASTAAVATDPAQVVAISPNNEVGIIELPAAAAAADGLANPTISQIGSDNMLFNGTTWDRQRGNWYTTTGDTGAKTATFNGATQTNYNARGAFIVVQLGTVSGTTPTLTAQLQVSYDDGTTWLGVGPASATVTASNNSIAIMVAPNNHSQAAGTTPVDLTTGATQTLRLNFQLPRKWRLQYTITGTTPSFAFTNVHVNYLT